MMVGVMILRLIKFLELGCLFFLMWVSLAVFLYCLVFAGFFGWCRFLCFLEIFLVDGFLGL